jgi:hypothetical protein
MRAFNTGASFKFRDRLDSCWPLGELDLKSARVSGVVMSEDVPISPEAERAGMLAALHAIIVGTLSTLKRKGLLTSQELEQIFEAGVVTFERGEPDDTRTAALLTLEILARSLRDPPQA